MPGPVRDLCAQDLPVGRGTQSGRVEGVEEDGCRLGVRIPLPTGGLAARGPHWGELQRSVPGAGRVRTTDDPVAPDCAARSGLWAGDGAGLVLKRTPASLRVCA